MPPLIAMKINARATIKTAPNRLTIRKKRINFMLFDTVRDRWIMARLLSTRSIIGIRLEIASCNGWIVISDFRRRRMKQKCPKRFHPDTLRFRLNWSLILFSWRSPPRTHVTLREYALRDRRVAYDFVEILRRFAAQDDSHVTCQRTAHPAQTLTD
jgi:hypothetical protein